MNHGPYFPYSSAMDACILCGAGLKSVPALGMYLVGNRGAIQYPLCLKGIKAVQKGLPPHQLHTLNLKLEARAAELVLSQSH